jgi:hypothetical protein
MRKIKWEKKRKGKKDGLQMDDVEIKLVPDYRWMM